MKAFEKGDRVLCRPRGNQPGCIHDIQLLKIRGGLGIDYFVKFDMPSIDGAHFAWFRADELEPVDGKETV